MNGTVYIGDYFVYFTESYSAAVAKVSELWSKGYGTWWGNHPGECLGSNWVRYHEAYLPPGGGYKDAVMVAYPSASYSCQLEDDVRDDIGNLSDPVTIDTGNDPSAKNPACKTDVPASIFSGKVGNPISIYNGNNYDSAVDLSFPSPGGRPITLKRYYNSRSALNNSMGQGWTTNYYAYLKPNLSYRGGVYLGILDETGRAVYFLSQGAGTYTGAFNERTTVKVINGNYVWYRLDGSRFVFNANYKLIRIEEPHGNYQTLTYDAKNRLATVADDVGSRSITFHYKSNGRVDYISGPVTAAVSDGIWVRYGYDASGNLVSVTYADGSGYNYEYNNPANHNLTAKKDKQGHLLSSWTYDNQDRAVTNFTRDGKGVSINYVSNNEVRVTDAYGIARTYAIWDIDGRKKVTDVSGPSGCADCGDEVKRIEYDSQGRVIEVEYAGGLINQYADFDSRGNAQTVREAVGTPDEKTIFYTYHPDTNARLSRIEPSIIGAGSRVTIWDYDDDGNATPNENPTRRVYRLIERGFTRDVAGQVTPYERITAYSYNSKGQVLAIDGPLSGSQDTIAFSYNASSGDLLAVTRPLVGTVSYSDYDGAGQAGRITDENGSATVVTHDGKGRIKTVTSESDNSTTTYTYNVAGEPQQVTAANGVATDFVYDVTYGRLIQMLDPFGNYLQYGYDSQGNRSEESIYSPSAERTFWKRFDYQSPQHPGKLWKEINPDNTYTEYSYDAGGKIQAVTDPAARTTFYNYDSLNRLTTVTQPGNVITAYGYDPNNNLTTVTDAENHATTYTYDDLGRLVLSASPDTSSTTYTYDSAGNLISKTDANGITTTYTYDTLNRLTNILFPDASQNITYSYDDGANGKGRLTGMSDPSGVSVYAYDPKGNLINETKTIEGVVYTTSYSYDPAGILTGMTYPDGSTVSYELDPAGRVVRATTVKNGVLKILAENIGYLPFGPQVNLTFGSGLVKTGSFDLLYRPANMAAGSVQNIDYTKDPAGNITAISDNVDPSKNQSFGYDDLYRLTSAAGAYGTIGYTYDKVGNRLTETVNGQTDTYTYAAGTSRLVQITGANFQNFAQDLNGNTTSVGQKSFTYNQNNRLIRAAENSALLAAYTYNGSGQRIIRETDGGAIVYHYDRFGNLIAESDLTGEFKSAYVYLNGMRLAAVTTEAATELTVGVNTDKGRNLSGVRVYAFTQAGVYTGKSAVTDEDGIGHFELSAFTNGSYKFRADYLSFQFWSNVVALPGSTNTAILIAEENATLLVTQSGIPKAGVKVYLFNAGGAYLGLYQTTDANGQVTFALPAGHDFKFRADLLGSRFFSESIAIVGGGANSFSLPTGGGVFSIVLDKGGTIPLAGVKTYLFSQTGSYLGLSQTSDAEGRVFFDVPAGSYKVRADYLGNQFWTAAVALSTDLTVPLSIPHQDVVITAFGDFNGDVESRENLKVYLFSAAGSYLGQSRTTDGNGQVMFNLPVREYKVRVDYLGQQFWSDGFVQADQTVAIPECEALVSVTRLNNPLSQVPVYVFSATGAYLGLSDTTAPTGQTSFRLPAGGYNFRADYLGSQYFSGNTTLIAHQVNPVAVSTGGGNFTLTVQKAVDDPMSGVTCYLFTSAGSYLGHQTVTSALGEAPFELADGDYKIRVDYLGYQFWTETFTIPSASALTFDILHQDTTITVKRDFNGDILPGESIKAYLFTAAGAYLSQNLTTDVTGQVVFSLPAQEYKVRADFLSAKYWSDVFVQTDQTISINEGLAQVSVLQGSVPVDNVPVYVFSAGGAYLGLHANTAVGGKIDFILPEGTYKFRADYQGSQYWATQVVTAHQVNEVTLSMGGGPFTLTVEKAAGVPLTGVPVYVFSSAGNYLGLTRQTDSQGQVSFSLSDGSYKFRADYRGYQFWSNIVAVPGTLLDVLAIPHNDVTVTVNELYNAISTPLENIKVYLFTPAGSYLGLNAVTDAQGRVTFNLPQKDYKVRADFLGGKYWSEVFNVQDVAVDIVHGYANVHVTEYGIDIYNAPVYLFTETGSYLGKVVRTDSAGMARLLIPAKAYKFRVDYNGKQYWSDVVNILANGEEAVDLKLDLLALNLTNDPNPVRFDGKPLVYEPEPVRLASLFDITGILTRSVVAQIPENKIYYYINDHLGTPQKMVDESGVVVWSVEYRPFGEVNVTANVVGNGFRFPGQYYDQETGLHYNYHRYYNPKTGRYLTPDPVGFLGGDLNIFTYVLNNPSNYYDFFGLQLSPEQNLYVATASALGGFAGFMGTQNPIGGMIGGGLTGFIATMSVGGDWDMNDLITNTALGMITGLAGGYFGQAVNSVGVRATGFGIFSFGIDAAVYGSSPQIFPRNDQLNQNFTCKKNEEFIEFTDADYQELMEQLKQMNEAFRRKGHY